MDAAQLLKELKFKAVRSSGAGGQHVNKVASKIELIFDLQNSVGFTDEEKTVLLKNLHRKLTKEQILLLQCSESRSQHKNKEIVIERFLQIITHGLKVPKKRKATKPSKASIQKRLERKKQQAFKKVSRKRIDPE
jgi:ribosome-associated protein